MRLLFLVLGHACVALGVVGVFVPLLPTTPFLLLAAALYARGSERLHTWLVTHPRLGPPVLDWLDHGVISRRAKLWSTVLIVASISYPLFFLAFPLALKALALTTVIGVLAFILSRPSVPEDSGRTP